MLSYANIGGNQITAAGAKQLANALKINQKMPLNTLSLGNNSYATHSIRFAVNKTRIHSI
jgi:hypothetical protein